MIIRRSVRLNFWNNGGVHGRSFAASGVSFVRRSGCGGPVSTALRIDSTMARALPGACNDDVVSGVVCLFSGFYHSGPILGAGAGRIVRGGGNVFGKAKARGVRGVFWQCPAGMAGGAFDSCAVAVRIFAIYPCHSRSGRRAVCGSVYVWGFMPAPGHCHGHAKRNFPAGLYHFVRRETGLSLFGRYHGYFHVAAGHGLARGVCHYGHADDGAGIPGLCAVRVGNGARKGGGGAVFCAVLLQWRVGVSVCFGRRGAGSQRADQCV